MKISRISQDHWIGDNAWQHLARQLEHYAVQRVLLVTGRESFTACGAEGLLSPLLVSYSVTRVFDFETNPKGDDIRRILSELTQSEAPDVIIAVGGGSVMDVAKLLKTFWFSQNPLRSYLKGEETLQLLNKPFIAIPTTAGSGSEATHFAVVYEGVEKHSVADIALQPDHVLLDSTLLASAPQRAAAAAGLDALCQGIESYWSIYSDEKSRAFASQAIKKSTVSLVNAVIEKQPHACEELMTASFCAGHAINITKTTAPHAVSYALAAGYGVQHGHAVALMVTAFFRYNSELGKDDCLDSRGPEWVTQALNEIAGLMGVSGPVEAGEKVKNLVQELGLEDNLTELGEKEISDISWIVTHGFNPQRVNNNPRKLTEEALEGILMRMR